MAITHPTYKDGSPLLIGDKIGCKVYPFNPVLESLRKRYKGKAQFDPQDPTACFALGGTVVCLGIDFIEVQPGGKYAEDWVGTVEVKESEIIKKL